MAAGSNDRWNSIYRNSNQLHTQPQSLADLLKQRNSLPTSDHLASASKSKKPDLQSTHFVFGVDKIDYQSHSASMMMDHNAAKTASGDDRAELKERMRNASFSLGLKQQAPKP